MSKNQLRKISAKYKSDVQHKMAQTQAYDALNPHRIGSHLPSIEEEYRKGEHHNNLCDSVKRGGAGDIKGGGLILRPNGMSAYKEFHDLYTREEEKVVEKKAATFRDFQGKPYDGPKFQTIVFPNTFCILCMRSDVAPTKGCSERAARKCSCCSMLDITTLSYPIEEINLKKDDVIRSIICPACKLEIINESKNPSGITIVHEGMQMPASAIKASARYRQLKRNWQYVLKASRLAGIEGMNGGFKTEGIGNV